ncbi:MAG: Ppx/GppA family phosphatase [Thermoanaerobacteraceae bacterium]|nr:Ppx/GppA family phosphatase [Thermoanaerobacteraceae bacterium]
MRVAVIDLGSNSIRLLIKDISEGFMVTVHKELATTRLGRGVAKNLQLDKLSMNDTLSVLTYYINKAKSMNCDKILAFGTSALREAKNSRYFIKRVRELGLDVDVLSGQEEALLSFTGARAGLGISGSVLVIDIGGGSTELILGKEQIQKSESLSMGAVRFTELYFKLEPPNTKDLEMARTVISRLCHDFAGYLNQVKQIDAITAVGVGGTLTTLSAMAQELKVYDTKKIHGYLLEKTYIDNIYSKLLTLPIGEKRKLCGLMPQRADIITAGTFIAKTIMENFNIYQIIVSETDIMEGFLLNKI